MNLRSDRRLLTTETGAREPQSVTTVFRQLPQYTTCVVLGAVGGAMGVALSIGLVIVVQLLLPPSMLFLPGVIPMMVMAALMGLGASWLLSRGAHRLLPGLWRGLGDHGLQVTLVTSTFISLLQALLFTRGL